MAYGVKYRLTYTNTIGVLLTADVEKLDYVGDVIEYTGGAESIKPRLDGTDKTHDPIKISSVDLSFFVDSFEDYDEFMEIDDRDYRVQLYENGTLYGIYWVIAEMVTKPLETGKFEIKLTAKDGLNTLKNIEYSADGRKLIKTVIAECLTEAGHSINFQVDINFNHSGESTADEMINQTYVNTDLYRKNNVENWRCFDVLKDVLETLSCRIQQRYGKWVICRIDVLYNGSLSGVEYTLAGATVGSFSFTDLKTIGNQVDATHVELLSGGQIQKVPAYREAWIKQVLGKTLTSSIYNGNFNLWNESDELLGWIVAGGATIIKVNAGDGNYAAEFNGNTGGNIEKIYQTKTIDEDDSSDYVLKFRFAAIGADTSKQAAIRIQIFIYDGVDYYYLILFQNGECAFYRSATYGQDLSNFVITVYANANPISSLNWVDNELPIVIGGEPHIIPAGVMTIRILEPAGDDGTVAGIAIDDISFYPKVLKEETGIIYLYGQNNPYFNFVPERIESTNGDVPAIANNTFYYKNYFSLDADGDEPTTAWNLSGDATDYLINELRLRSLLNTNSKNLSIKRMRLQGQINPLTILVDHLGKHYQITSYQGELNQNIIDVTAIEIVETETNVPTITQTDYPADPDKINDYTQDDSDTQTDRNDSVALVDEDSNVTTVPGFLLETDWDIILAGTKTIFSHKPKWRSEVKELTAGNNRVDFLNSFPESSNFRLQWKAMKGNNIIASKILSTDDDGFDVWVSDDCTFDYFANLYY